MKNILVLPNLSIAKAMKKLSETAEKGLVVVNKNNKLLGTLTDGDIRRKILKGFKLNFPIQKIYNKKPSYLIEKHYKIEDLKRIFDKKNIDILPILNKKKQIIKYITRQSIFGSPRHMVKIPNTSVVIMAGGKGLRLDPFTKLLPKPLIPIDGKPIIEYIIEKFISFNLNKFILTLNYKSKILKSFFEERDKKSFSVSFLEEKKPLGTAGGLKSLYKKVTNSFFVTNCDILINTDYKEIFDFHKNNKNDITIVASAKEFEVPYGVCEITKKGLLSSIKEKPVYNFLANTGLYLINKKVLKLIPKNKNYDMNHLITNVRKKKGKIGVFPVDEKSWFDIGQWKEYHKTLKKINLSND